MLENEEVMWPLAVLLITSAITVIIFVKQSITANLRTCLEDFYVLPTD